MELIEANNIREKLAKGSIDEVIHQLSSIDDHLLVKHEKDIQVFIKIKVWVYKECDKCGKQVDGKRYVIDVYEEDKKCEGQSTFIYCKSCFSKCGLV